MFIAERGILTPPLIPARKLNADFSPYLCTTPPQKGLYFHFTPFFEHVFVL
jgi:hypothetical protein